jgi:hypothetical protein
VEARTWAWPSLGDQERLSLGEINELSVNFLSGSFQGDQSWFSTDLQPGLPSQCTCLLFPLLVFRREGGHKETELTQSPTHGARDSVSQQKGTTARRI